MKIKIFFCYAHEDEALLNKLKTHIRPLQRQGIIDVWHDRNISAGTEWEREIDKHLRSAQIILLLVSPDFIDSDYCFSIEMKRAIERHEQGEARAIPIILRHVYWQGTPLGRLQALPTDAKPVISASWHSEDEAFFDVTRGIIKVANELLSEQWLDEASASYKAHQYKEALTTYENLILLDATNTQAYKGKGMALYQLGRGKEALAVFEQASVLDPNDATLFSRKGIVLEQMERYQEALSAYEQAIRLHPHFAAAYNSKGNILDKLQRYNEALEAYEQAIQTNPRKASYYNNKGNLLSKLKQYRLALAEYEQAIQVDPTNSLYQKNRDDTLKHLTYQNPNASIAAAFCSGPGIKEKNQPNEDSIFSLVDTIPHKSRQLSFGLFVVSDGGVQLLTNATTTRGQEASHLAIQTFVDYVLPKVTEKGLLTGEAYVNLLSEGVQQANQALHQRNMEESTRMGAGLTVALIIDATAYIANVGDSRAYLYRQSEGLYQITHDHSVVASLVEADIIKAEDIYTHPKRNQIYRSLGEKPVLEVDTFNVPLRADDRLLLCSHGLWTMVRDPLIAQLMDLRMSHLSQVANRLMRAALEAGGEYNISVVVAQKLHARSSAWGKPLVRRAPYLYEDDPLRQELAQYLDAPIVRRSSRYTEHEDE